MPHLSEPVFKQPPINSNHSKRVNDATSIITIVIIGDTTNGEFNRRKLLAHIKPHWFLRRVSIEKLRSELILVPDYQIERDVINNRGGRRPVSRCAIGCVIGESRCLYLELDQTVLLLLSTNIINCSVMLWRRRIEYFEGAVFANVEIAKVLEVEKFRCLDSSSVDV